MNQRRRAAFAALIRFTTTTPYTLMRITILVLACLPLIGCGVVAAPCRVSSALIDMVPIVGHVAATPTDACAEAIDPK